jgi:tetratricopeptide (TPR) repeat protein
LSKPKRKLKVIWLAAGVVAAGFAALVFLSMEKNRIEVPRADFTMMETQVAEKILNYEAAVKSDPTDFKAWANLAQAFQAHDLFAQAIASYARAMELRPEDWRWPYLSALAQAETDPQASLSLFETALELKPTGNAAYINYGDTLMRLGENNKAEEAYGEALRITPESSHALYGLAQSAMVSDDPEKAIDLLKQAKAIAPRHGEIYSLLAQAYQRAGDKEAARDASLLAKAWPTATRAPDPVVQTMESLAVDSQSISRTGVSLAQRGEYVQAEAKFRQVLEIRPGNARDYANLGGALAGQGKTEEALAAYRQGLEADPADVDTLNNLGFTLMQLTQFDEAKQHLKKAFEIDPTFAPALGNLGLIAQQQQQSGQAIEYFEKALEIDPGLLFARNAMAAQLVRSGNVAGAIEQWQEVLQINPDELAAIYNIAMAESGRGEHAEAIEHLRRGLSIAPDSSRLVAALAWELATAPDDELRDGTEALQLAQRVYKAYPNQPQIIDLMAAALAETGDFENAIKLMEPLAALGGAEGGAFKMRLKAYRKETPWRQIRTPTISVPGGQPAEEPEQ